MSQSTGTRRGFLKLGAALGGTALSAPFIARHALAAFRLGAPGYGQEGWDGGKRVNQEEDRAERQQGEAHQGRTTQFGKRGCSWVDQIRAQ